MALDHSSPGMFCAVLLNCPHCCFRSLLSHSESSNATYVGGVALLNVVGTFKMWSIKQIFQHWPTLLWVLWAVSIAECGWVILHLLSAIGLLFLLYYIVMRQGYGYKEWRVAFWINVEQDFRQHCVLLWILNMSIVCVAVWISVCCSCSLDVNMGSWKRASLLLWG